VKSLIADPALKDLQDIKGWYLGQGVPDVGQRFVEEILEQTQNLISHPGMGRAVPEFGQQDIRELLHPPFRLVYLRSSSAVNLVRVWRSERLMGEM
jgi:toxin ParE1/3/4